MKKILIFLANGFEDIEAITVIDILRRGGIEVTTASISKDTLVESARGVKVIADDLFSNVKNNDYDMLVLPGGSGVKNLKECDELLEMLKKYNYENKYLAAICAAPSILGMLNILKNRCAVCYKGFEKELLGAIVTENIVEIDGNIITSKSAATSLEFSFEILNILLGESVCNKVKGDILY